jgi:hypothetical protein
MPSAEEIFDIERFGDAHGRQRTAFKPKSHR